MSETESSGAQPGQTGPHVPRRLAPSYLPGRIFWILLILYGAAVAVARVINDDGSYVNLTAFIGGGLCALTLLAWFAWRSAYPLPYRILIPLVALAVLGYLASQYRIVRFSGDLFPEFGRRQPPIDTALAQLRKWFGETGDHDAARLSAISRTRS